MFALVIGGVLYQLESLLRGRKHGSRYGEHSSILRYFFWVSVCCIFVLVWYRPDITKEQIQYEVIKKNGSYIQHDIGSSSDAPIIDVTGVSSESSYIENSNYVWVKDGGTEKKLPIESYDVVKGDKPSVSYTLVKYEEVTLVKKIIAFPVGLYNKDYTENMVLTLPE